VPESGCSRYAVSILPAALRVIERSHQRKTLRAKIDGLQENPRPQQAIHLQGRPNNEWRLRVGDYRVTFVIDDAARTVLVKTVETRGHAYRN
jgi:mRNA interferase RelE/StbE